MSADVKKIRLLTQVVLTAPAATGYRNPASENEMALVPPGPGHDGATMQRAPTAIPTSSLPTRMYAVTLPLFVLLALATPAFALDPQKAITQFVHTSWTEKDGAPANIRALAQTTDGYLWMGTTAGLFRFDGVRFARFEPEAGESLPGVRINGLLATRDGALWISLGVSSVPEAWCRLFKGHVSRLDNLSPVYKLVEAPDGTLVAGTTKGLWSLKDGVWSDVSNEWHFPGRLAKQVYFDKSGWLWVVTDDRIVYRPVGQSQFIDGERLPTAAYTYNLAEAPDGTVWISEIGRSAHALLRKGERGPVTEVRVGATWVLFDRNGSLWVGSAGDGVRRVPDPRTIQDRQVAQFGPEAEQFAVKEGLSGNFVYSMVEDREGNIWVGTVKGLDRFRESAFVSVPVEKPEVPRIFQATRGGSLWVAAINPADLLRIGPNGNREVLLRKQNLLGMCEDETGTVWAIAYETSEGVAPRLLRYQHGQFVTVPLGRSTAPADYRSMACGQTVGIWLFDTQGGVFRYADGALTKIADNPEGARHYGSLYADPKGRVWLGETGRVRLYEHGESHEFGNTDGVPAGAIFAFHMSRAGHLWIGGDGGLSKFENGRFRSLSKSNGWPAHSVYGITEDDSGSLWLACDSGVLRVPIVELHRAVADPTYQVRYESFDLLDGLPGKPLAGVAGQGTARTRDGRIWFATSSGIAYVDPKRIPKNTLPPPVLVESLSASGRDYTSWNSVQLPARTTSLQIAYTATSLTIPERVRFRYQLEGIDRDWQDAGTRRTAFYSNLGPRKYRFRVIACNNDGVWNEIDPSLEFSIAPAYYQTTWFRLSCVAAFLALLGALYQLRLRQVARQFNMRLEARVSERTRIARELHDTLLQSFQGLLLRFQAVSDLLPERGVEAKQIVDGVVDQAAQAITEGRDAVQDLRSSTVVTNDLALDISALGQELAANESSNHSAAFRVEVEGTPRDLHPILRDEVYRIAAEALRNAFKHAQARQIEVEIRYDERRLRLCVRDDGKGLDPTVLNEQERPGHWGLPGMRERAKLVGGRLEVWSKPNSGTEIELSIPASRAYATSRARRRSWFSRKETAVK